MCTKAKFDSDTIAASAEQLKYISEIRKVLGAQFTKPDQDWVRMIASRVTTKRMTAQNLDEFTNLVSTAQAQFLRDEANRRLRTAQEYEEAASTKPSEETSSKDDAKPLHPASEIVTTDEEFEAFRIIRAIGCAEVPIEDITIRDAKTYCAILFQDNNRRPIARLYFDRRVPQIGIFDVDREEHRFDLTNRADIYQHSELIRARCASLK